MAIEGAHACSPPHEEDEPRRMLTNIHADALKEPGSRSECSAVQHSQTHRASEDNSAKRLTVAQNKA